MNEDKSTKNKPSLNRSVILGVLAVVIVLGGLIGIFALGNDDTEEIANEISTASAPTQELPASALPNEEVTEDSQSVANRNDTPSSNAGIALTVIELEGGVEASWLMRGVTSSDGFEVVRSLSDTPTFGVDESRRTDADTQELFWEDTSGETYFYRVCVYRSPDTCDTYSTAIELTSPTN